MTDDWRTKATIRICSDVARGRILFPPTQSLFICVHLWPSL
jgi:hypothetical protein